MSHEIRQWRIAVFLFCLGFWVSSAIAAPEWSLARDRDGIKVWTRDVPDFPAREFKAVTHVQSTLNGLVALVMDTENAKRWIYRTEEIDVIKRDDSRGYFLIRVVTDFPWPLTDRDAIIEGNILQDARTGIVTIHSKALPLEQYPERKGLVRMTEMWGTWIFKPLGKGLVEVTMLGRADPAGSIPYSAINLLIHETPYRTLQGMRKLVQEQGYQQVRAPQIQEVDY